MKRVAALAVTSLVIAFGLLPWAAMGAATKNVLVKCGSPNASIQDAVDSATGPTKIRFFGTCDESVTITKDDITFDGQDVGTVSGTITFDGAQRGVVENATVTGPGSGIVATNGASVLIRNNDIRDNGDPLDAGSGGVVVTDGSTAQVRSNTIADNAVNGIIVDNGAYASITDNSITGNGAAFPFDAAGIGVFRAVARGQGNTITDNKYAGISVYSFASYRTGSFLSTAQPDNDGDFETIDVGSGLFAVDMGNMAFVDLRQVLITGDLSVGRKSLLQIRGDNRGPDLFCSQIVGTLNVDAKDAQARLSFTHVTGAITVDGADALISDEGSTDTGSCPNLPLP